MKGDGKDMTQDYLLMKKIADGDKPSMAKIFDKYREHVYRYAFMITKDCAASEDIAQDVFIKVIKNASSFRYNRSLKAWILQITRNTTLNYLKHCSYSESLGDDIYEIKSGEDYFSHVEFLDMLKNLNPADQEVILLRIVYGLKHKEIAEILKKSPQAVRQQYRRAIQSLKNSIMIEGSYIYEKN